MSIITTSATIDVPLKLLDSYGLSQEMVLDNGPQITSENIEYFSRKNGVQYLRILPVHTI